MSAMPHDQEEVEVSEHRGLSGIVRSAIFRAAVVTEAKTWIGTPFHHAARVKGAGVDCLMLLAEVYERAGVTTGRINPPFYVPDWHLHRDAERYMEGLLRYARPVDAPEPGDIALFRFGRTYSHGAISHRMAAPDSCLLVDRRRLGRRGPCSRSPAGQCGSLRPSELNNA